MTETPTSNDLRVAFQKLRPQKGDLIVMRFPNGSTPEQRFHLADVIKQLDLEQRVLPEGVGLILLPEGYDLESIDSNKMKELGWVRSLSS